MPCHPGHKPARRVAQAPVPRCENQALQRLSCLFPWWMSDSKGGTLSASPPPASGKGLSEAKWHSFCCSLAFWLGSALIHAESIEVSAWGPPSWTRVHVKNEQWVPVFLNTFSWWCYRSQNWGGDNSSRPLSLKPFRAEKRIWALKPDKLGFESLLYSTTNCLGEFKQAT